MKFKMNLYNLKEGREMKATTFTNLVATSLYEKRLVSFFASFWLRRNSLVNSIPNFAHSVVKLTFGLNEWITSILCWLYQIWPILCITCCGGAWEDWRWVDTCCEHLRLYRLPRCWWQFPSLGHRHWAPLWCCWDILEAGHGTRGTVWNYLELPVECPR